MNVLNQDVVKEVFAEFEALESNEYLSFIYNGDSSSSSSDEDKVKYEILELFLANEYADGHHLKGLGSENVSEFHVRLTAKGFDLLDEFRRGYKA